jgi:hypothetical protein
MEDGARVARDRCLAAIVESGDEDTQRALWRAALRYNGRMREIAAADPGEVRPTAAPRAAGVGMGARELEM